MLSRYAVRGMIIFLFCYLILGLLYATNLCRTDNINYPRLGFPFTSEFYYKKSVVTYCTASECKELNQAEFLKKNPLIFIGRRYFNLFSRFHLLSTEDFEFLSQQTCKKIETYFSRDNLISINYALIANLGKVNQYRKFECR